VCSPNWGLTFCHHTDAARLVCEKIPWRRTWRQRRRPATPTHQLRALLRAFPRLPLLARGAGAPSKAAGPRAGGPLDGWCVVRWPTQGRQRRRILVCRTRLAAAPFWALQLAPLNVQASWTVGSTRNLRRMRWARPAAPGRGESAVTRGRPPKQGAPQRKCVRARRARSGTRGCCGRVRLFRIGDRLGKILTVNKRRRGSRNTNITHRPSPFVQLQD
jgi:hypothetical protein